MTSLSGSLADTPETAVRRLFRVGDYQRGYRWGPDEAQALLDDITQRRDGERYYLQPIVVKKQDQKRPVPPGNWSMASSD